MAVHKSDALREFLADGDFNPKQAARLALLVEGVVSDNAQKFATKNDLQRLATRDDLQQFVTKDDLKKELKILEQGMTIKLGLIVTAAVGVHFTLSQVFP